MPLIAVDRHAIQVAGEPAADFAMGVRPEGLVELLVVKDGVRMRVCFSAAEALALGVSWIRLGHVAEARVEELAAEKRAAKAANGVNTSQEEARRLRQVKP